MFSKPAKSQKCTILTLQIDLCPKWNAICWRCCLPDRQSFSEETRLICAKKNPKLFMDCFLFLMPFQEVVERNKIYLDDKPGKCNLQVLPSQVRTGDLLDFPLWLFLLLPSSQCSQTLIPHCALKFQGKWENTLLRKTANNISAVFLLFSLEEDKIYNFQYAISLTTICSLQQFISFIFELTMMDQKSMTD